MISNARLSDSQARLKLTLLSKQAEAKNSYEVEAEMREMGLAEEVMAILRKIMKVVAKVAGKAIAIGKVVVIELLKYAAKHPFQVAGLAIGLAGTCALGLAVHQLFGLVPALAKWKIIGGLLAKLMAIIANITQLALLPFMVAAPVAGGVGGEILDRKFPQVGESIQQVARDFFEVFASILDRIKDEIDFSDLNEAWT
jgi:hypothetical protein